MPNPVRTLIADDHDLFRQILARFLANLSGVEVVASAANGDEALRLCIQAAPDLVILDLVMPGLNGIDTTLQLRQGPGRPRIVILSMHDDAEYRAAALAAGADAYVCKADMVPELAATITRLFS